MAINPQRITLRAKNRLHGYIVITQQLSRLQVGYNSVTRLHCCPSTIYEGMVGRIASPEGPPCAPSPDLGLWTSSHAQTDPCVSGILHPESCILHQFKLSKSATPKM